MGRKNRTRAASAAPVADVTPAPTDLERQILDQGAGDDVGPLPAGTLPQDQAPAPRKPARKPVKVQAPLEEEDEPVRPGGGFSLRRYEIRNKHTGKSRFHLCPLFPPVVPHGLLNPGDVVTNNKGRGDEVSYTTEAERDEALSAFGFGPIDPLAKNELGPAIPHH